MPTWKKLLIDLSFILLYGTMYHFIGFEFTAIIVLAQIMGHLIQKDYPTKPKLPPTTYRYQQKGKVKF
jgi:hypothetical protein